LRRRCKILSSSQSCGLAALSHAYRAIRGRCCVIEGSGPAPSIHKRIRKIGHRSQIEKNASHFVESDSSCRHHYLDGWLALAIGCWDKVVDRQPLNWHRPLELQFPLAKEERRAKLSLASTPASPQTKPLESWSSAPPAHSTLRINYWHRRTLSVHRVNRNARPPGYYGPPSKGACLPSLSDR
jgi:hypothetical protein